MHFWFFGGLIFFPYFSWGVAPPRPLLFGFVFSLLFLGSCTPKTPALGLLFPCFFGELHPQDPCFGFAFSLLFLGSCTPKTPAFWVGFFLTFFGELHPQDPCFLGWFFPCFFGELHTQDPCFGFAFSLLFFELFITLYSIFLIHSFERSLFLYLTN